MAVDKYYVPISLAVPGSAVPPSKDKVTLDVAGFIRDERGFPVGRIRDTLTVPPASAEGLGAKQVLYQTGVTLPPGRFSLKLVVRENTTGQMGTFETPVVVPELKNAGVLGCGVIGGDADIGGTWQPNPDKCQRWSDTWPEIIRSEQAQLVVGFFGAWDMFDRRVNGQVMRWGTPELDQFLTSQLDHALQTLAAKLPWF